MNDSFNMSVSIPTDDEGYVLLQCSNCGTYFKATPTDINDDSVLNLFCPSCGLVSDNYITDDVLELVMTKGKNIVMDMLYDSFRNIERNSHKGPVTFKAGKKPKHDIESPIHSGIEAMEIVSFPCCKRSAKIKSMLKMTGCYCLFCGVKNYEFE